MVLSVILYFLFPAVAIAVDPDCNYYQNMEIGPAYYVFNKEYPSNYTPSRELNCFWKVVSPINTKINVQCHLQIPPSTNCSNEKIRISLSGNSELANANIYCGVGTFTDVSNSNILTIGLLATRFSTGGRFLCILNTSFVCDCSWMQKTTFVGHKTSVKEYPFMVELQTSNFYCSGAILSNRYILTAAHCVYAKQANDIYALVDNNTYYNTYYQSEKLIVHPDFNEFTLANDIALVRTKEEIKFNAFVGPICLPFRYSTESFTGKTVTALGWAEMERAQLEKVDLEVLSTVDCRSRINDKVPVSNDQICTYGRNINTCQRDIGGPIVWMDPSTKRFQLVGVISGRINCGHGGPIVNTRVTSYLDWITNVTNCKRNLEIIIRP